MNKVVFIKLYVTNIILEIHCLRLMKIAQIWILKYIELIIKIKPANKGEIIFRDYKKVNDIQLISDLF